MRLYPGEYLLKGSKTSDLIGRVIDTDEYGFCTVSWCRKTFPYNFTEKFIRISVPMKAGVIKRYYPLVELV